MKMISFLLSVIVLLINGLSVLRFYQIKDYLYRKALAHFYFPTYLRSIFFNKKEILFYLLYLISLIYFREINLDFLKIQFLLLIVVILFWLRLELIKKIRLTFKSLIILISVFVVNFTLLRLSNNNLLILATLIPWLNQFTIHTFVIKLLKKGEKIYICLLGKRVTRKINFQKQKGLKIIGICGSYGKSGTKEILTQILKENYRVLSLPPRMNHEYAILKYLSTVPLDNYDYLIIEFGSYYLGNIKLVTKYITPDIAFITGITKQHLYLFGNIKNIIIGEGIEILTWMKKGILLVNSNHEYFEDLSKKIITNIKNKNIELFTYGKFDPKFDKKHTHFSFEILDSNLNQSQFKLQTLKEEYTLKTNLIFPMQIENLVGVLSFISIIDDIKKYEEKIKNIQLPEGFLQLKIKNNFYVFDDSYNANPKGVFSALAYFKNLDLDYKIIIFNGLFELGQETKKIYQKLKEEFLHFDKIILTSNDFIEITGVKNGKFLLITSPKEFEIFLNSLNFEKIGIWIINRFPERVKINL